MKIRQRWLAFLLSAVMVVTYMPAIAFAGNEAGSESGSSTEQENNADSIETGETADGETDPAEALWTYEVKDDHVVITKYTGSDAEVIIPDSIEGLPVTELGSSILEGKTSVTDLTIPSNINIVNTNALYGNRLRTLRLDWVLNENQAAPEIYNYVRTIVIGANCNRTLLNVGSDGYYTWYDSQNLEAYEVDENNQDFAAEDGVLFSNDKTVLLRYPRGRKDNSYTVPDNVKLIGPEAFTGAQYLTELHIPASTMDFGENALGSDQKYSSDPKTNDNFVIFAEEGSEAEQYAIDHAMPVKSEDESSTTDTKDNATRTIQSGGNSAVWDGVSSSPVVPEGNNYKINNAAELKWLSDEVNAGNSFKDCNVLLTHNIDLNDKEWVPIGNGQYPFRGNFDGQYHTIKNLKLSGTLTYNGLFGFISAAKHSKITVKNISIKNVTVSNSSGAYAGALTGGASTARGAKLNISGIIVSGTVMSGTAGGAIGRIWCGHSSSTVKVSDINVLQGSKVYVRGGNGGGIVGSLLMDDTNNDGGFNGTAIVRDCKFNGGLDITNNRWGTCGGIVGSLNDPEANTKMTIEHCRVDGTVYASSYSLGGGVISTLPAGHLVKSCVNYAMVHGYNAGGITAENSGTVEECYNGGWATAMLGGENSGLVGINRGSIFNCYNSGYAPNSSALSYNGAIAASGSGTAENTYNIGQVAASGETSIAVSHSGVFGYSYGMKLIHCYYDNANQDYLFGNVKDIYTVITDADKNIFESGGKTTAEMKTQGTYTNWDFDNVWEFDLDYSKGYPVLTSIKDLLDKDPDTKTKNKMKKTQFKFTVVDQDAKPVENAIIYLAEGTSDEIALTTDSLGRADTPWQDGSIGVRITKEGYIPYEDASFAMNKKREIKLMIIDQSKADEYPLSSVIMEQHTKDNYGHENDLRYELLTQSRTINRQWSSIRELGVLIGPTEYSKFTIKAIPSDAGITYVKAELVQKNGDEYDLISASDDPMHPEFKYLEYNSFNITKEGTWFGSARMNDVMIRMTDQFGREHLQKINLTVEDVGEDAFEINFDDGLEFTVPGNAPLFKGAKISIPVSKFPGKAKLSDDCIEFGIGSSFLNMDKKDDELRTFWKNWENADKKKLKNNKSFKKQLEKFCKYAEDPMSAVDSEFGTDNFEPVGKPSISMKALFYGHADLPWDKKVTAHLVLQFTIKVDGETQVSFLVVGLEGRGTVTGDGSVVVNFQNASLEAMIGPEFEDPQLTVNGEVAFGAYVGAGVANFASAGIYGDAAFGFDWRWAKVHTGFEEVYINGTLGACVRILGSNAVEIKILEGKYPVYDWEGTADPEGGGRLRLMSALETLSDQEVVESAEDPAGEWTGGDGTLQAAAYSGSTPVVMNAGGTKVMLLTSNTDTARAAADRSELMYSVYNQENGSWSSPAAVADDGTADFNPSVAGNYVVWNNATGFLTGCKTYNDLGRKTEVCIAEFDSESGKFINAQNITNNDKYENRVNISGGSSPVISWTTDSDDNIMGLGSVNTFYSASKNGGSWSISKGNNEEDLIVTKTTATLGNHTYQFYVADIDHDLTTTEDQVLRASTMSGEIVKLSDDIHATQFAYAEKSGKLFYTDGAGNLFSLTAADAEPVQEIDDNRLAGALLVQTIDDESGNVTIVMTKATGNSRNAYIMKYNSATSKWSNPVALFEQTDYVEGVNAWYEGDELVYAYNQRKVQLSSGDTAYSDSNSLHWSKTALDSVSLEIESTFFSPDLVVHGETLPLSVFVTNKGMRDLESVGVKVETASNVVSYDETIQQAVAAGKDTMLEIELPIAEDAEKTTYTVTVYDPENTSVNAATSITIGEANFKLDKEVYNIGGHEIITASVTNSGFAAGSGQLVFYDTDNPDKVLDTYKFGSLEPDEIAHYSFKLDDLGRAFNSLRVGMRVVDSSGNILSDERQAQIWRSADVPVSGVSLAENLAKIENVGDTLQLSCTVQPQSAAENAILIWESSNPESISVDENGLVTAKKQGKATITVYSEDKKYYDECLVYAGIEDIGACTVKGMKTRFRVSSSNNISVKPSFKVVSGTETLVKGTDYDVEYFNNDKIGDAYLIITGKGHYTGSIRKDYKIKTWSQYNLPDLTGFELDKHEASLITDTYDDGSMTLQCKFMPEDAGDKTITWISSDDSVATVRGQSDGSGYVRAVSAGTCTITATTRDGGFTDTCKVNVSKQIYTDTLNVEPLGSGNKIVLEKGHWNESGTEYFVGTEGLLVSYSPENAYSKYFDVKIEDEEIVRCSRDDEFYNRKFTLIAGEKTGQTTVTVYTTGENDNRIEKSFTVEVVDEDPTVRFRNSAYIAYLQGEYNDEYNPFLSLNKECEQVKYSSSDESILTVDSQGNIQPHGVGDATVTATGKYQNKGFTASALVRIVKSERQIREIYPSGLTEMLVDNTAKLTFSTWPEVPRSKEVTWSSSDDTIATVDENGLVTAVAPGEVTITATAVDGGATGTITITVKDRTFISSINFDYEELSIELGDTNSMHFTVSPEDATDKTITWSSSNSMIAQVTNATDNYIDVRGGAVGSATITGTTANGVIASFIVEVYDPDGPDPGDDHGFGDLPAVSDTKSADVGTITTVQLSQDKTVETFTFTPETSGYYVFESYGNEDPVGIVRTENETIAYMDDGDADYNFHIKFKAEKGTTYYLQTRGYSTDMTYDVKLYPVTWTASAKASTVYLDEGSATLEVSVEGDADELTFNWYSGYGYLIKENGESTLAVNNTGSYYCIVGDGENSERVNFKVDSKWGAYENSSYIEFTGSPVKLEAITYGDVPDLDFSWAKDNGDEYIPLSGAGNTSSLTVTSHGLYRCAVTDGYDTVFLYYTVEVASVEQGGMIFRVDRYSDEVVVERDYDSDTALTGAVSIPSKVKFGDGKERTVTRIGSFGGAAGMTAMTIPTTVTEIESYALVNTGLKSITIPANVTKIGHYAVGYTEDSSTGEWVYTPVPGFVINAPAGSAAASYAKQNGLTHKDPDAEKRLEADRQGQLDKSIPKLKISKPSVKKAVITAKWKKLTSKQLKKSKATKIEVWVCPNKSFRKADTKIVTVSKKKASAKVKGLKRKTKYFVKVRAIKYVGNVKKVGPWSKTKPIKTK